MSSADPSLYIRRTSTTQTYILIYVDDILFAGDHDSTIQELITQLSHRFNIKRLGHPRTFLGVQVSHGSDWYFLSQLNYARSILQIAGMLTCKPVSTLVAQKSSTAPVDSTPFDQPSLYRKLVGSLQYLILTRPDITFTVNLICQHMHAPTRTHYQLITQVLRYLQGTITYILPITKGPFVPTVYSDSNWAGDTFDRKSIIGYCIFLGHTLLT